MGAAFKVGEPSVEIGAYQQMQATDFVQADKGEQGGQR